MIKNGDNVIILERNINPESVQYAHTITNATVNGATNVFYKMTDENGFDIKKAKSNVYKCVDDAKEQIKKEILTEAEKLEDTEEMYLRWIKQNKEKAKEYREYANTI